ncbi:MAG: hypothetical protein HFJ45_06255 [Clostridia bacterium]|nr:hypothetical protein [Clostridia bacterium]
MNYTGTSLVTFAGCETAMGPAENLTTKAVDRGSTAALGWRVKIHFQSLKNWANRYSQKLSEGKTLIEAIQYANGFMYVYDDVKDCGYAGNGYVQIKNPSSKKVDNIKTNKEDIHQLNFSENEYTFYGENQDIEYVKSLISKEYKFFNENDYEVNIFKLDDNNFTIDFIYKVDNVKTDMGFVVTVTNNKVSQINNFMNEESIKVLNEKIEKNILENEDIILNIENDISKNIKKHKKASIEEESGKYFFSSTENKLFYVVGIKTEIEGAVALNEFKQEIN